MSVISSGAVDPRQQSGPGLADQDGVSPDKADNQPATAKEKAEVEKFWKKYDKGRKFDENFRKQIAVDRKYAAGTSDLTWAVTTNLIGAFIDILVALLYARDPDVSVRKSPQVDYEGTASNDAFARTMEIVISHLWKKGKLKKAARKAVRSVLSNGEGWLKCTMVSEKSPSPVLETKLNDVLESLGHLEAMQKMIEDPDGKSPEEIENMIAEQQRIREETETKIERKVNKTFVIDYVPTENIQVSPDVQSIEDYVDANWLGNEMYIEKEEALAKFPRLTNDELTQARMYYQRAPKELMNREQDTTLPQSTISAESAQAYTLSPSDSEAPPHVRVVEMWNRVDKHIYTAVEGVKKWAVEPYEPPYPSSRFYPYFYFAFYEVDGQRHAQSLAWRLYKLQDEYSATRSAYRITRERSVPGVLFNATMLDDEQAAKLSGSKYQEYVALRPSDPSVPLSSLFAPKPVQGIDARLYDPQYILSDMERISGVQEALSAATTGPGNPVTATQASIQQTGTNARTTSNRDNEELMLNELAQYTAEQSLQCLSTEDVMRIAGPKAMWPAGMDIEDLFTLVNITIEAGSTGKPRAAMDQQAWATILPLIKEMIGEIAQALGQGDMPTANAKIELVKETMLRLGDESDVDRFIPKVPPPGSPGAGAPPPPVMPQISISLRGEIDGETASKLAMPAVAADDQAAAPPQGAPTPGGGTPPGANAPAPPGPPSAPGLMPA